MWLRSDKSGYRSHGSYVYVHFAVAVLSAPSPFLTFRPPGPAPAHGPLAEIYSNEDISGLKQQAEAQEQVLARR
jgi:hypothetical protein